VRLEAYDCGRVNIRYDDEVKRAEKVLREKLRCVGFGRKIDARVERLHTRSRRFDALRKAH
jgi:hypothetical protein